MSWTFLLSGDDDDDCMKTVFRPLDNVVDAIYSEFYNYICGWLCPCCVCVLFWLLFFVVLLFFLLWVFFSLLLFYLSALRQINVFIIIVAHSYSENCEQFCWCMTSGVQTLPNSYLYIQQSINSTCMSIDTVSGSNYQDSAVQHHSRLRKTRSPGLPTRTVCMVGDKTWPGNHFQKRSWKWCVVVYLSQDGCKRAAVSHSLSTASNRSECTTLRDLLLLILKHIM